MIIEIAYGENAEESSQPQNRCVYSTDIELTCPCCHRHLTPEHVAWMLLKELTSKVRQFTTNT